MSPKWKKFNFGEELNTSSKRKTHKATPNKRRKISKEAVILKADNRIDTDSLAPLDISQLAVHANKISEVEDWLIQHVLHSDTQKHGAYLLISGPTGCAKSATIKVLCRYHKIRVLHWINPIDHSAENGFFETQFDRFREFLFSSKYVPLGADPSQSQITLVDEFPNVFLEQAESFHLLLESHASKSPAIVVFVCTNSNNHEKDMLQRLFPAAQQSKYKMHHISFNPCAKSFMEKAIKRAIPLINKNSTPTMDVPASVVQSIALSASGDLRAAMNQLIITLMPNQEPVLTGTTSRTKKQLPTKVTSAPDCKLIWFKAIGRVLYPKLDDTKKQLKYKPDDIISGLVGHYGRFFNNLFENYHTTFNGEHLSELGDVADCLSSTSVMLDKGWDDNDQMDLSLWAATATLMMLNRPTGNMSKWKWQSFRKPHKCLSTYGGNASADFSHCYKQIEPGSLYYMRVCHSDKQLYDKLRPISKEDESKRLKHA